MNLPPLPTIDEGLAAHFPRADVSYQPTPTVTLRPRYFRCVKTALGKSIMVRGNIENLPQPVTFLIDSGAQMNIIPLDVILRIPDELKPKAEPSGTAIMIGDGTCMKTKGIVNLKFTIGEDKFEARFYVPRFGNQVVLGTSFMEDYETRIIVGKDLKCYINGKHVPLVETGLEPQKVMTTCAARIEPGMTQDIEVQIKNPEEVVDQTMYEPATALYRKHGVVAMGAIVQVERNPFFVTICNPTQVPVTLHASTCIGSLREIDMVAPVSTDQVANMPDEEPMQGCPQPENQLFVAHQTEPEVPEESEKAEGDIVPLTVPETPTEEALSGRDTPLLRNNEHDSVTSVTAEIASGSSDAGLNQSGEPRWKRDGIPEHLGDLYERSTNGLHEEECKRIKEMMVAFSDIFATSPKDIGRTTLIVHDIYTGRATPVHQRARRQSPEEHEAMKKNVENLRDVGIIEPSTSEWASNVRMVKKKDGTWRMCVDYRDLNNKTKVRDPYLLPRIDAMLDSLSGTKLFSCLDLIWGYHQVPLTPEARERTAFITPHMSPSHWQYVYMPFGLRDAPATFQRLVDRMLAGIQYDYVMAYIDDIIVKGDDVQTSVDRLYEVFRRIRHAGLKLKPSKCELFQRQITYLGHIISADGMSTDPKKIQAIKSWPVPVYLTDVRGFIGLCSYYRRFIQCFGTLVKPLSSLTMKTSDRTWREIHTEAFDKLKEALTSAPLLAFPKADCAYIRDTDASTWAIGAVLSQLQPDEHGKVVERPIAYGSRLLLPRELNYCTRRRELLAIYEWVQHYQHYLAGQRFTVRTDHDSLKGINNLAKLPGQFARWLDYLNGFSFEIKVRAGTEHANADFLSRIFGDCFCKTREMFEMTESAREALRDEPVKDWDLFERCAREVAARRIRNQGSEIIKVMDENALKRMSEYDLKEQLEVGVKIDPTKKRIELDRLRQRLERKERKQHEEANTVAMPHLLSMSAKPVTAFQPTWTIEELREAQRTDPELELLYKCKTENLEKPTSVQISGGSAATKAYFRDWSLIECRDGVLYRYFEDADRSHAYYRVLVPQQFHQQIVEGSHEHGMACHQGYRRTYENMKLRFHWHEMRSQLRIYTRACAVCQRKRTRNVNTRHEMVGFLPGYVNERVNMDVCGPFTVSSLKNKYLLVICDSFSKYVVAVPVPDTRATTLADAFLRGWCTTFGYPTEIHTDRGSYFTSEFWKDMCDRLHLKHTLGSALRPQSNGQNERQIRAVQETLRIAINGHRKKDWDIRASYATAAYNFTPHSVTKFAPHELMFGKLPQMEIDFLLPRQEPPRNVPAAYLQNLVELMRLTFLKVRNTLRKSMELRKERYDGGIRKRQYEIGQPVALKQTNKLVGNDKLSDKYCGPYYILTVWNNGVVRIQLSAKTKPKLVHVDRVEPWIEDDVTRPQWVEAAVLKYAPNKQEVGLQVELLEEGGEIVDLRPVPAGPVPGSSPIVPNLTPIQPRPTKNYLCQLCGEPEIDSRAIRRTFTRAGICQICRRFPTNNVAKAQY